MTFGIPTYDILYSGANHSFIYVALINNSSIAFEEIYSIIEVTTPSGKLLNNNNIDKAITGWIFKVFYLVRKLL